MRKYLVAAVAQCYLLTQAGAAHITVEPSAIAVVLPPIGSKDVPVSVSFAPSPDGYTYRVFLSSDPQCLNPSTVVGVTLATDQGQIPAQGQFEDYDLEFEVNGFLPGEYLGTLCVTIQGQMIPSERDAIPINLEISDDSVFVNGFEK